jgi:hypothetical protein
LSKAEIPGGLVVNAKRGREEAEETLRLVREAGGGGVKRPDSSPDEKYCR